MPHVLSAARRVPLLVRFGFLSLLLIAVLGGLLELRLQSIIEHRAMSNTERTMAGALGFISEQSFNTAMANQQSAAQLVALQTSVGKLVQSGQIVGLDAWAPPGTLAFSDDAAAELGTTAHSAAVTAALGGRVGWSSVTRREAGVSSPRVRRLLARYGELMQISLPVHVAGTPPITVAAQAYVPMAPIRAQIKADTASIARLLVAGLLALYLGLFRLVYSASRRLRRQAQENRRLALHDGLTGLPNRELLRERTERAIVDAQRTGRGVALMLLDLDRFKEINDTLGHHHGDRLLKEVGARLQLALRNTDTVARLGGDEFVALLPDLPDAAAAQRVGEEVLAALAEPVLLDGVTLSVTGSIGIAVGLEHGDAFDDLLQHADVAMYAAKRQHLGVAVYRPGADEHSRERLELLGDLRRAVEQDGQLVLHYQPKARTPDLAVIGVEALVRWQHPRYGLVPPDRFIPLAEYTGLIKPLTARVLDLAVRQAADWLTQGMHVPVAVNISARSLLDAHFPAEVGDLLGRHDVPAELLELEITESSVMTDPERALTVLNDLAARGIALAIDDFGTGYSSMAYLKRLPINWIKIDRTFVTAMDADTNDAAIVRASVQLAHELNVEVVAEGVETPEVHARLREVGCDAIQGYYLSRPRPAAELEPWLRERVVPRGVHVPA